MEKKQDETLEVPFVLSIVYNPSIAQMSLKGNAYVNGEKVKLIKSSKTTTKKAASTNNYPINFKRCLHRVSSNI